nr:cytosine permease [Sphingomonas sp. Y57]
MGGARTWRRWFADNQADAHDDPNGPITADRKQSGVLLLLVAFCWGVLATGMLVGGTLIKKMPFEDFLFVTLAGNTITLLIGWLAGEIGFRTGLNTGLLFRAIYGRKGALLPVFLVAILATGWHAVVVGAMGFAWAQSDSGLVFALAAIGGGILITITTIFGIRSLEKLAVPKAVLLVGTGLYACSIQIDRLGGWAGLMQQARERAPAVVDHLGGINMVVGSWIVGAIVMAEYTRFARSRGVAMGIPFCALMVAQWMMQIFGAIGVASGGHYEFTAVLIAQGALLGALGLLTMTLSLWVSGSANIYFPGVQVAAATAWPRRLVTLAIGLGGTIGAFGLYQHFEGFITVLGNVAPPIIGPVFCQYYLLGGLRRGRDSETIEEEASLPALAAFFTGALATFFTPPFILPSLFGLLVSMAAFLLLRSFPLRRAARG